MNPEALLTSLTPEPENVRARLLRSVFDAPAQLQRRQVLADWLFEHGEPWGEFIALQLLAAKPALLRATKLLRRHRAEFLGPLAPWSPVADPHEVWEHGFPVRLRLFLHLSLFDERGLVTLKEVWVDRGDPRVLDSPWWAPSTVRHLSRAFQEAVDARRALYPPWRGDVQ